MNAKRLVIAGRVHGVGYRAWMVHKANELGLYGWVRNRPDGAVEALIAGDIASVEELSRLCRRGPRLAEVSSIDEDLAEPAGRTRIPCRRLGALPTPLIQRRRALQSARSAAKPPGGHCAVNNTGPRCPNAS